MERSPRIAGVPWRAYRDAPHFGMQWTLGRAGGSHDYGADRAGRLALDAIRGHSGRRVEQHHAA